MNSDAWSVPSPILFNTWKHHAGAVRQRLAEVCRIGEPALTQLPDQVLVIGTELMDFYIGPRPPAEIAERVLAMLQSDGVVESHAFRPWIEENGGYRTLTFPEDGTVWVVRAGAEDDRYIHLHPGRWTPLTMRVRANTLKTAVLTTAYVGVRGGDARETAVINRVRKEFLGLSPIRELLADQGLGILLDVLTNNRTNL